jgi:desulfoferrodoxin-like iron-binding protein
MRPRVAVCHIDQRPLGAGEDRADPSRGARFDQSVRREAEPVVHALLLEHPRDRVVTKHDLPLSDQSCGCLYPTSVTSRSDAESPKAFAAPQLGKRYRCQQCGTEVLCLKPGGGVLRCHGQPMTPLQLRPLPSSD